MTDLTGRFGHVVVVGREPPIPGEKNSHWRCRCDCGAILVVCRPNLVGGNTRSCGCKLAELRAESRQLGGGWHVRRLRDLRRAS